jgi:CBS domain-containing protein
MKPSKSRKVEDFMTTAVISMRETDTIGRVDLEMHLADVRHIPVVDEQSHVVGILSSRDVLRAYAYGAGKPIPASKFMTKRPITVRPGTPAHEAAAILLQEKIGALPVVGEDEQLVGIVTATDFLAIALHALRGESIERA